MAWVLLVLLVVWQQKETVATEAEDNGPVVKEAQKEAQKEDLVTTVDSMAQEGQKQLELMTKEAQMPV